jgi:hypothetical protein
MKRNKIIKKKESLLLTDIKPVSMVDEVSLAPIQVQVAPQNRTFRASGYTPDSHFGNRTER